MEDIIQKCRRIRFDRLRGESRQIRNEGSSLTVTLGFALVLIYLVTFGAVSFLSRSAYRPLGLGSLAISGALALTFLGFDHDQTSTHNVGLITLVGLVAKNEFLLWSLRTIFKNRDQVSSLQS